MSILENFIPKDDLRFNEDGTYRIRDTEFAIDGKPYCKKCKEPKFFEATKFGYPNFRVGCQCSCQATFDRKNEQLKIRQENERKFKENQRLSVLGKNLNKSFDDYIVNESNKDIVSRCKAYCKNSDLALERNVGFYIYGKSRVGKTLLTSCMCNELVRQGRTCLYTSIRKIVAEIEAGWSNQGVKEAEILRIVENVDFLFIDDFGAEFDGNERPFVEKKVFAVIDAREKSGKPIIITSNFTLGDLSTRFKLDERITKRIDEMAKRKIQLYGVDE